MRKFLNPAALLLALAATTLMGCGDESAKFAQPQPFTASLLETESELDSATVVHVVLSLHLNDSAGLDSFISELNTHGSVNVRKHLTPAEVATRFGPTRGRVNMVTGFLEAQGFTNVKVARNNLLVEADAPASVVASAFKTKLAQFRLEDGTAAYANTVAATLPANLEGVVQEVLGLDTVTRVHSLIARPRPETGNSAMATANLAVVGHNPVEFPALYNAGSTPNASNIRIGIIAWGKIDKSLTDLQAFTQQNNLPAVTTSVVYAGAQGTDTNSIAEWSLDSQAIVGMSGGVQRLEFYVATSAAWSSITSAVNAAVSDNSARVINMSMGACEVGSPRTTMDNIFKMAIAQGQTFAVSSGDNGSNGPTVPVTGCMGTSVLYPASSPHVITVGGTTLRTNSSGGYDSETAWSLSGGGISSYETIANWQPIAPPMSGRAYRGLPDIAFNGDPNSGANIIVDGQLGQYGGTSLSAPLFAAAWARILSQCGSLGFAAPALYASRNLHASMFNDVTSGSNGAYSSAAGWDFVTGWGTPNISNLRATVCPTGVEYNAVAQQIYVGYLGRPADPAGLANMALALRSANAPTNLVGLQAAYGTNAAVRGLINNIQGSAESQSVYPTTNNSAYVAALFQALFNRAPNSTEANSYETALSNGTLPKGGLALKIMSDKRANPDAALTDVIVMQNKVAIASNFTATLTPATAPSYSGATAAGSARHMVQTSSSSSASVEFQDYTQPVYVSGFQQTINSVISAMVAGTPW
jgi:pseudomonalisin